MEARGVVVAEFDSPRCFLSGVVAPKSGAFEKNLKPKPANPKAVGFQIRGGLVSTGIDTATVGWRMLPLHVDVSTESRRVANVTRELS
jgi:hypothetical protein